MKTRYIIIIFAMIMPCLAMAQDNDSIRPDEKKRGLIGRVVDYISNTNCPDTTKRLDISFLGGPFYTTEFKFGVGIIASGLYRRNPECNSTQPGQVNLYGNVSFIGYFKLGINGVHYMKGCDRYLIYDVSFESAPDKYWGVGYEENSDDANESKYKRQHVKIDAAYMREIGNTPLHVGPHVMFDYLKANDVKDPQLWHSQKLSTVTNSVGIKLEYDTRDYRFNPNEGLYFLYDQMFAPRFLGNKYAFSLSDFNLSYYRQAWKGSVIAANMHLRLTYGNTPWGMMSKMGGSHTMRGYWEGRYNDRCEADATVELRQHVYRRSGIVAWVGLGEVFAKPGHIFKGHALPNFGVGYRWEFKKRVNLRVDYGFGRKQSGIVFSINEAF